MKEKGFTLIELMIVVAIIGILLAVVIGNFTNDNQVVDQQEKYYNIH